MRHKIFSGNHGFFAVDPCTHCAKTTVTNDDLSYLIVRSLTEGEIIETTDEVDRAIIDDMMDTDRQIILNFLEKYRKRGKPRSSPGSKPGVSAGLRL